MQEKTTSKKTRTTSKKTRTTSKKKKVRTMTNKKKRKSNHVAFDKNVRVNTYDNTELYL